MTKPAADQPKKLTAYTQGYGVGFNGGEPDSNPWKGKHGNFNRGFENAWRDGWVDGWNAGKPVREAARAK